MPSRTKQLASSVLTVGSMLLLAGCESSLNIDLATNGYDGADQLVLALDGVDLLDSDASKHSLDSDADAEIDALDYSDGETLAVTSEAAVSTARYVGLRLRLADSGSLLQTSSGAQYPLTLNALAFTDIDLDLAENETADLLAMLDLRFSLYPNSVGGYTFKPYLRVMHKDRSASVSGTVDADLVKSDSCRDGRSAGTGVAVYAFEGASVTPQDFVTDIGGSPVASATVSVNSSDSFSYSFPFLTAGTYTLALTCQADSENPASSDGLTFLTQANVSLDESEFETVNLTE